jgi:glycosyltransferase involved in cell wall biosynthesis
MNICIDMRPALSHPTGVGVYLQNIARQLSEIDELNSYHLFSSSWKERYPRTIYGKNFQIHDLRMPVRVLNYLWSHFSKPSMEWLLKMPLDIVHSPTPLVIPARRARKITTVMDLHFYFYPEHTQNEIRGDYARLIQQHSSQSDAIIAISEHTRTQLIEQLNVPASRVYTIHLGADEFYFQNPFEEELQAVKGRFKLDRPYFLFVGAQEPRKNLGLLIRAFSQLPPDVSLVLAGPRGWGEQPWREQWNERIIETGYVSKIDLRALYRGAVALVQPSLEEGFGLPLLEAMSSATPVLASRIPVFSEICGDAFLPFDNTNEQELQQAMLAVCSDSSLRNRLIARGTERAKKFSWRETAKKTLEIYNHL